MMPEVGHMDHEVILSRPTEQTPMQTWGFDGISATRVASLLHPFEFSDLAARLRMEARRLSFKRTLGSHEAKGRWRPEFSVEISSDAFDLFFNSPDGYRGQFLRSVAEGQAANALALEVLSEPILQGLSEPSSSLKQIATSLMSDFAKIWIDEHAHAPSDPVLIVEVKVPTWEAAARAVRARLDAHDSTLTSKEIDRIFGVRAPTGTVLKIMGAWVSQDGSLFLVPSKHRRGEDIRDFGVS
jgi:hypothetical protein